MRSLLFLALVGCGGGSGGESLVLHAKDTKLAAVHTDGAWKRLALNASGDATVALDGPTMIATVCDDGAFLDYYTVAVGPGTEELGMYCGVQVPSATLTINAASTTHVFVGLTSPTYGGETLTTDQGTYDIIALDTSVTPARIEIRRGVAITGNTTLTFDLATAGTPMTKARVEVTGAEAGETPSPIGGLTLVSASSTITVAFWTAANGDVWLVPAALLQATDHHYVSAGTTSATGGIRSARRKITGGETAVTLALPGYVTTATATFGAAPTLAWQGDARFDDLYFGINNADFSRLWDIMVLPTWADAGGAMNPVTIPDPRSIPGWSNAWNFDDVTDLDWMFFASHEDGPTRVSSSRNGTL